MSDFYQFLADHNIEYERHDHPAVYTVEESERLVPALPGAKTKNLFLRDKKGERHFLVVVPAQKRLNIKALPEVVGSSRLSFGSAERLKKYLGVEAGANVALATERGETTIIATVTDRMPGGLVAIPSYVPDVRGLLAWTLNPSTKWYDVAASGAKVTPGT